MVQNKIKKQSILLSQLIVESEEYKNLIKAQEAVKGDPYAFQLMMNYQTLVREANNKIAQGATLSEEEIRALTEQEEKIQRNKTVQHWGDCQTIFSKMLANILEIIQQGLAYDNASYKTEDSNSGRLRLEEFLCNPPYGK